MRIAADRSAGLTPISVRDLGSGATTLLHLHGGWGYDIYPIDRSLESLESDFRVLIPDRAGYGQSGRRSEPFPLDFHRQAAEETLEVMDALAIDQAVLWGHSDGACTAAWMAIEAPTRCRGVILESLHLDRAKPASRDFFLTMAREPREFGSRVAAILEAEHGADYWQELLRLEGDVWNRIRETPWPHADLFNGRLGEVTVPTLVVHGALDPRTEPDELDGIQQALPEAAFHIEAQGGHCPHSETQSWRTTTDAIAEFLGPLAPMGP